MTKEPSDERKACILLAMSQIKHNCRMVSHMPTLGTKCVCPQQPKYLVLASGLAVTI